MTGSKEDQSTAGVRGTLPSVALGSVGPVAAVLPSPIASLSLPLCSAGTTLRKGKGLVDLGTIPSLESLFSPAHYFS